MKTENEIEFVVKRVRRGLKDMLFPMYELYHAVIC